MKRFFLCLFAAILCLSITACRRSAPEPTPTVPLESTPAPAFLDSEADYFGRLGDQKLYNYYLACTYRTRVDEFVKKQHDYDPDWDVEAYFDFTKDILEQTDAATGKTNREILQKKAIQECLYMVVLYNEALNHEDHISENAEDSLRTRWEKYGNQCYGRLQEKYPYVQDADTGLEVMTGGNVEEVIDYMIMQTVISQYTANWFYNNDSDNRDFAQYYQEHVNDFRRVTVRAVYVQEQARAEEVRKLMNKTPEHIANLARAYNEDKKLAETNGLVVITSDTLAVPEKVKEWAYKQTPEVTFYEHGNIEILPAENGYYLLMCEMVEEYKDDVGNEVYKAVGKAYKAEQLNAHLDELLEGDAYKLTAYDFDKAVKIMDESFKV